MALIERVAKAPASAQVPALPLPKAPSIEVLPPFAVTELRGAGVHGSRQFHTHLCQWCTDLYTHTVEIDGCASRTQRLCQLCKDTYHLIEAKGGGYNVA